MSGPDSPCQRSACADEVAHVGGAHLDPTSDLYDGPESKLGALPLSCRSAAQAVLYASRADHWREVEVRTALHVMAEEILRLRSRVAAVSVDRDRGIRDAMKKAEDCAVHGEMIRHDAHQAHWFSVLADRNDAERVEWLGAAWHIRDAFATRGDPLARKVVAFVDAADKGAKRARKRFEAPSLADCERAGKCDHPTPQPHAACEQLTLDFDQAGVAA